MSKKKEGTEKKIRVSVFLPDDLNKLLGKKAKLLKVSKQEFIEKILKETQFSWITLFWGAREKEALRNLPTSSTSKLKKTANKKKTKKGGIFL